MKVLLSIFLALAVTTAAAQAPVMNFTLTDVVSEATISLDKIGQSSVVIVFTSNACPYDVYYTDRLKELVTSYSGRIPFLFINSHLDAQEDPEKMKVVASGRSYAVPYLSDKDQTAMKALDARRSPEAFVLKLDQGTFSVVYNGAIDDNPQAANAVNEQYLKAAIDKVLGGQKPKTNVVRGPGCTIKKK